ncbi:hypothetical protein BJ508DRAFT_412259 [Ascobolus immersus RN42]|uniref:Uncharacterized protein n=1 Tax=Ascobolus immersus RN42 TaxID=1160509 RepID=A0A3N4IG43_ASCIM|nr:hypothetical protein BJ508DRAFT_412259 [Ascobolus immersus RN42]
MSDNSSFPNIAGVTRTSKQQTTAQAEAGAVGRMAHGADISAQLAKNDPTPAGREEAAYHEAQAQSLGQVHEEKKAAIPQDENSGAQAGTGSG